MLVENSSHLKHGLVGNQPLSVKRNKTNFIMYIAVYMMRIDKQVLNSVEAWSVEWYEDLAAYRTTTFFLAYRI